MELPARIQAFQKNMASNQTFPYSEEEWLEKKAQWANEAKGNLTGYDCEICKNRGFMFAVYGKELISRPCTCQKIRRSLRHIRDSGLEPLLKRKTFPAYQAKSSWQQQARQKAMEYTKDQTGAWMMLAGCTGAGKTHLCTAACGLFLKRGIDVRYMLWIDEIQRLKAARNEQAFMDLIRPWKQASILYIDDLFKTKRGAEVTDSDIRLAFEIINSRYIDPEKRTILSSERPLEEIIEMDQGIGGRLREKTKGFYVWFSKGKDWRLI